MFVNTLEQGHLPYMPVKGDNSGAGILLIDSNKKLILLGKRTDGEKLWCTPGGKIKDGETPSQGVKRETYEEARLRVGSPIFLGVEFGSFKDGGRPWVTYMFFADVDSDSYNNAIPQASEISVWEWVSIKQVLTRKLHPATQLTLDKFSRNSVYGVLMDRLLMD